MRDFRSKPSDSTTREMAQLLLIGKERQYKLHYLAENLSLSSTFFCTSICSQASYLNLHTQSYSAGKLHDQSTACIATDLLFLLPHYKSWRG